MRLAGAVAGLCLLLACSSGAGPWGSPANRCTHLGDLRIEYVAHTWDPEDPQPPDDEWPAVDVTFRALDLASIRIAEDEVELTLRPQAVRKLHLMGALAPEKARETSGEPTEDPFTIESLTVYRYRVYVAGHPTGWWAHPVLEEGLGKLVLETAPDELARVIEVFETSLGCEDRGR